MRILIYIFIFLFVGVTFSSFGNASDYQFYGSSRMSTFMENKKNDNSSRDYSKYNLNWFLHPNSRIGAKVESGLVFGQFELDTGIDVRKLFATFKFYNGKLKIGQDYTPITFFLSRQAYGGDSVLRGLGNILGERLAQISFSSGNLEISFIEVTRTDNRGIGRTDYDIPKIEGGYKIQTKRLALKLVSGYQTYKIEGEKEYDITSWMIGAGGKYSFYKPFYINASASYYINPGDADWRFGSKKIGLSSGRAVVKATKDAVDDFVGWMGLIVVGAKVDDSYNFEAGFGWVEGKNEQKEFNENGICAYLQCTIPVADGFYLIPELGYLEGEIENYNKEEISYVGIKWQIDF